VPEQTPDEAIAQLSARVRELEHERDRLLGELDTLTNRSLAHWLSIERRETSAVDALHQTLSWRVTKPLRVVREAQLARLKRSGRGAS
jgi:hypothetical protein